MSPAFFCFLGDLIYYTIGLAYWQHPFFFAYFPIASTFEGILGDLYASSVANPVFTWASGPTCSELEAIVMD
ncbi:uncharacterized protein ARMOST_13582 [Armillaria ostoyae]|uniref:Uncharacterized protein n=1 Tax=Armillaria ostoyae TaxID=47428 RepID=A0A284RN81_ARMOS|nr:uncharacterized protein ARMOST_13582 [Armillaria ostoyae]